MLTNYKSNSIDECDIHVLDSRAANIMKILISIQDIAILQYNIYKIQYTRYKKLYLTSVCIYRNISSLELLSYYK